MPKKLRILVTGANGFIGSHLARHLTATRSYRVSGLVRKTSDLFRLKSVPVDLVIGSLNEPLSGVLKGFDVVVHTAAKSSYWGSYDDFYRTNVEGTISLLEASMRSGVRRFIHFSSVAVYGFHGTLNTREDSPRRPFQNPYCTTKALTEERMLDYRDRIEIIILRPSNVFGPLDTTLTLPLLRSIEKGLPAFPRGGKSLTSPCYIGNLAYATERAILTHKGLGEAYNISDGKDIAWREFLAIVARELGSRPPWLPVPAGPLYALSLLVEGTYRLLRSPRPHIITPNLIAQVMKDYSFSIDKAVRHLGYEPPFTTEEGIRESARWYREYKRGVPGRSHEAQ